MNRRAFLLACLLAPISATADDLPAEKPAETAAPKAGPEATIVTLNDALLQVMHEGHSVPFAKRVEMLRPVVEHTFDLRLLLRNSVGSLRWPAIPEDQKTKLLEQFEQFTIASYVANFDAFNGEKFVIVPDSRKVDADVVVPTRLVATNGDITKLDYVLRQIDGAWRIVDILLDGTISRVAVTRSDFRSLLAPGDASKLIASLHDKVVALTDGSAS